MWKLNGLVAHWETGRLAGTVDIARPWQGLQDLRYRGQSLDACRCLQIGTQPRHEAVPERIVDCYVRGVDLVVTYDQLPQRPLAPQIYWRGLPGAGGEDAEGIEAIVSLKTDRLDSDPRMTAVTQLPADGLCRLVDPGADRWEPFPLAPPAGGELRPDGGTSLLLARLPGTDASYAEMLYPADFHADEWRVAAGSPGEVVWSRRLFEEHLEKGVIRRVRLCGVFLPADADRAAALAWYRQFAASDLPLTA